MNEPDVVKRLRRRLPSRADVDVTFALKVLALIAVAIYLLVGLLNFFAHAIRTTGLLAIVRCSSRICLSARPPGSTCTAGDLVDHRRVRVHRLIAAFAVTLVAPQIGRDLNSFGHALPG